MKKSRDRSILTWWDLAGLAFRASWRYMAAALALIAATSMWIYHVDRDTELKNRIIQLELQADACQGIRDLADAIDRTPSGSRTAAGSILAGR